MSFLKSIAILVQSNNGGSASLEEVANTQRIPVFTDFIMKVGKAE